MVSEVHPFWEIALQRYLEVSQIVNIWYVSNQNIQRLLGPPPIAVTHISDDYLWIGKKEFCKNIYTVHSWWNTLHMKNYYAQMVNLTIHR